MNTERTMPELLDIIGQDEAIGRLQVAMHASRLPHAYLFAGPAGVGRRTTAGALARTLLCESPVSQPNGGRLADLGPTDELVQACGQCADCKMLAAETHPDLHLVYKELARYHDDAEVRNRVMQELGIPVIRSFLIAPSTRMSARGRGKVFVVLEAELMSAAAQNCLLKTLEEPPDGVTIILISRRPQQLLPTTLSRCVMIRFRLLPSEFVTGRLVAAGVDAPEAAFWAAFTGGSVGRAVRLAQKGMYQIKRDIVTRLAQGPADLGEHLTKLADKLALDAVKEAKKDDGNQLSKNLAARQAAAAMLELIAGAFRDAVTVATGANLPIVNEDQIESVKALQARFSPAQLADIIDQLSEYERLLWRNVNPKLVWDNVAITCASAAPLRL